MAYDTLKQMGASITFADLFYIHRESYIKNNKVHDLKELDLKKYSETSEPLIYIAKDYQFSLNEIYVYLHQNKIKSVFVYDSVKTEILSLTEKPVIGYLEMHLVDHCNLNCRGCSHLANISPAVKVDIDCFTEELICLNDKFNVQTLRLMGGEPLLHPQISELLTIARKILPESRIELVTNGLLIPKMDQKFWAALRDENIVVSVSGYKPTMKISTRIIGLFESYNVRYIFDVSSKQKDGIQYVNEFHKCLTLEKDHNGRSSSRVCFGKNCYFYKDFKISKCAYPAVIHLLNDRFSTDFEIADGNFWDIREIGNGWEMLEKVIEPMDFCSYCIEERPHKFEWTDLGDAVLEDYIIGNTAQ